jgi:hypothetical protein
MAEEMRAITVIQIKTIKTLQGKAKIDDALYREMLHRLYQKRSCKELSFCEAESLIRHLRSTVRLLERKACPARITRSQQSTIMRLWRKVTFLPPEEQDAGLRAFLARQCGVEMLRWVPRSDGPSIICALKAMQKQQKEESKCNITQKSP